METFLSTVRFSVAMATYNGARFLAPQLQSLAAQTLLPLELVVRDDGSQDDTLGIIEEFARSAPFPVHVHRNPRKVDYSDNFLRAAALCAGDWIAFCDQDDIWEPEKLARVSAEITRRPTVVFCAHRASIIDEDSRPSGNLHVPVVEKVTLYKPLDHTLWWSPFGLTQAFDARLVREFSFEDRPQGVTHDCWIFWLGNILGNTLFLPDRLVRYRRHGNNVSSFTVPANVSEQLAAKDGFKQYLEAKQMIEALVSYLETHRNDPSSLFLLRIVEATAHYKNLSAFLSKRTLLWDKRNPFSERVRAFVRLLSQGAYLNRRKGRLGFAAGLKDSVRLVS